MAFRKFRARQLFNGYQLLNDTHVLVTDESGKIETILPLQDAGDDIELLEGILTPGLINCHCHLELSHLKNVIPPHTGLIDFLCSVVTKRDFAAEIIQRQIEKAEQEMYLNGIVAVGDICNNTLTIAQKRKGRLQYHNFIEASGFPPAVAEQRFKRAVDIYNSYATVGYANSIVPHAPYSVSPDMFGMINNFPNNDLFGS